MHVLVLSLEDRAESQQKQGIEAEGARREAAAAGCLRASGLRLANQLDQMQKIRSNRDGEQATDGIGSRDGTGQSQATGVAEDGEPGAYAGDVEGFVTGETVDGKRAGRIVESDGLEATSDVALGGAYGGQRNAGRSGIGAEDAVDGVAVVGDGLEFAVADGAAACSRNLSFLLFRLPFTGGLPFFLAGLGPVSSKPRSCSRSRRMSARFSISRK